MTNAELQAHIAEYEKEYRWLADYADIDYSIDNIKNILLPNFPQFKTVVKIMRQYVSDVQKEPKESEPYFGWCDVEGCEREASSGGFYWQETGYWKICYKHSALCREDKPQPQMKQSAIDRENSRLPDGRLPNISK
jgi:hypothetical protein